LEIESKYNALTEANSHYGSLSLQLK